MNERGTETATHLAPPANMTSVTAPPPGSRPAFFLRTKLLPPRPTLELLSRPRLTTRLQRNLANPITLVTANAGSGKTTLVAEFVQQHSGLFVWYQLDYTDSDPLVFLGYLCSGLQRAVPDFGTAIFPYLNGAAGELALHPEYAVDVLLNEVLEKIEHQLIIVLDDYHHLAADSLVHRVVDRLVAYLPDVLHIIIIARDMPPLALARRRAQSMLEIIDRADLLFTDEETQQLFRRMFDLDLSAEQLAEYRERTQGWITALQLVRQLAQRQALANETSDSAGKPNLSLILRQSEHDIFDYFAEEVFADEPAETQQLLPRLALLERVELETCTRLYPDGRCAAVLPSLVRRNVFVTVARDERGEEYRIHPLFRDFLRRRLRSEIGRNGVAAEQRRCAGYFLEQKLWEPALGHLLAAEDFVTAAQVLAAHGDEWIANGALTSLSSWAEALPDDALAKQPRALVHWAEVARLYGKYDRAWQLLQRATKLLRAQADAAGEAEAWHALASIARRRGDYNTAFDYLAQAVALTDEASPVRVKCGNTRGLCLKNQGRWSDAEHEFRLALQEAEAQGNEHYKRLISHNLGLPAMLRGDFSEALRWLRRLLSTDDGAPPKPQTAVAHLNIARCHFYRGEFALCEGHLNQALELCQTFNLLALRGEIFETFGNLYREQRDATHAAEFYERAARAYDAAEIDPTQRELWEEQAFLRLQQGDLFGARGLLERLLEAHRASGSETGCHTVTLARSRVLLAQGDTAQAEAGLQPALNYFHERQIYYYEAQACVVLAGCSLAQGAENVAVTHIRRALDLAARYDYEFWLRREVETAPQLFGAPDVRELLPPDVRELLPPPSAAAPPVAPPTAPVIVLEQQVTDLTLRMLGPVEICRDPAQPLPAEAWTTRRARDILCFIASRRQRQASKDIVIDTFWGESEFEVIDKNFHPTISHIRKALNFKQALKQNFLLYRDGAYQLNPAFSYAIDTEDFAQFIKDGNAARRERDLPAMTASYEKAIALYRGEFMSGVYDDWAEEQRGYLREQYTRLLESLVKAAQMAKDWPRSLDLAQQLLQEDPFREEVHCLVMRAHAALGNRSAVKERYQMLCALLAKELGVQPSPDTQRFYRQALGA